MYNRLVISKQDRILIVAPHPDDETVGCGGLLALYGAQCDVLLLTDGRKGGPADGSQTESETAELRRREFDAAMAFFGVRQVRRLELPDSALGDHAKAVSAADLRGYSKIFIPYRLERHPDHAAANRIIRKQYKKQRSKAELLEYEVWSPITAPNRFLDISAAMDRKLEGIRLYASQVRELNYEALAAGLNGYRGAPHHIAFCEAFYSEAVSRGERKQRTFAKLPKWMRKLLLKIKR